MNYVHIHTYVPQCFVPKTATAIKLLLSY